LLDEVLEPGFVFGFAACPRLVFDYARGFGLADAFACIGFDGFGCGELRRLAFRHGKEEYGIV
jgi:hypothetical protein